MSMSEYLSSCMLGTDLDIYELIDFNLSDISDDVCLMQEFGDNTIDYDSVALIKDELLELYLKPNGRRLVSERTGISYNNVGQVLSFLGFYSDEIKNKKYKLKVEEDRKPKHLNPFSDMDSDTSAYLLGFITGGGRVLNGNLVIACNDYDIIEKIMKVFDADDRYLYEDNKRGKCKNTIYTFFTDDYSTVKSLESLGIERNKSINGCPNLKIPDNHFNAFVRGVLDADGYIRAGGRYSDGSPKVSVSICGHSSYLSKIRDRLSSDWIYKEGEVLSFLDLNKRNSVREFYYWLYDGAEIYLDRKYNALMYAFEKGEVYGKYREYSVRR